MDQPYKRRYVLVVRLPRQIEARIEDAYLGLSGSTRPNMGYHITLLGSFLLSAANHEHFYARVSDACRNWHPFAVRLAGLDTFPAPDNNVVYLCIPDFAELVALHNELLAATQDLLIPLDEHFQEWNVEHYQPHVTLGLNLTDKELEEFLHTGAMREMDRTFEVTRLWLAGQTGAGPWEYLASYALGSSAENESPHGGGNIS